MSKVDWQALGDAMRAETAEYCARELRRDRCEALVPELVSALRGLLAMHEEGLSTPAIDKARDVLAKAERKDTRT